MGSWYSTAQPAPVVTASAVMHEASPIVTIEPQAKAVVYPTSKELHKKLEELPRCRRKQCCWDLRQHVLDGLRTAPERALLQYWPETLKRICRHTVDLQIRLLEATQAKSSA